jgi:hypothetical protein
MSETLSDKIENRIEFYVQALNASSGVRHTFTTTRGRKYIKVVDGGSVHAFIEIATGYVYKPAGWAKPADHIRYYLMRDGSYKALIHAASQPQAYTGGYLYLR